MWKLAYVKGKESLVFIFKVPTLKFIEIFSDSIKLEACIDGLFLFIVVFFSNILED